MVRIPHRIRKPLNGNKLSALCILCGEKTLKETLINSEFPAAQDVLPFSVAVSD